MMKNHDFRWKMSKFQWLKVRKECIIHALDWSQLFCLSGHMTFVMLKIDYTYIHWLWCFFLFGIHGFAHIHTLSLSLSFFLSFTHNEMRHFFADNIFFLICHYFYSFIFKVLNVLNSNMHFNFFLFSFNSKWKVSDVNVRICVCTMHVSLVICTHIHSAACNIVAGRFYLLEIFSFL